MLLYLGVLAVLPQVKGHTEPFNGREGSLEGSLLVARAVAKVEYVCHWNDLINDTTVKPLVLVIGLTLGGIAGIIISIMLFYLSGKAYRGPGGAPM